MLTKLRRASANLNLEPVIADICVEASSATNHLCYLQGVNMEKYRASLLGDMVN